MVIKRPLQHLKPAEIIPHALHLGSEYRALVDNGGLVSLETVDLPPSGVQLRPVPF